jgi:hypothetical protein
MLGKVFERFVEKSPISVMVRGMWERVLRADQLNAWYERTAQKQYTRNLLFSTVYDLLSQVVFGIEPSVHAVYRHREDTIGTSLVSVDNKLNRLAVVLAALRSVSGEATVAQEVSLSSIANALTTTSKEMMMAMPAPAWRGFGTMSPAEMGAT